MKIDKSGIVREIYESDISEGVLRFPDRANAIIADMTSISDDVRKSVTDVDFNQVKGITAFMYKNNGIDTPVTKLYNLFPNIKEITAPKLKKYRDGFFEKCQCLEKASLSEVEEVRKDSFYGCINLKEVNIPKATKILSGSFQNCYSLSLLPDMSHFERIDDGAFSGAGLTEIELKECYVDAGAFSGCSKLALVSCNDFKNIDLAAFWDCLNLKLFKVKGINGPQSFIRDGHTYAIDVEDGDLINMVCVRNAAKDLAFYALPYSQIIERTGKTKIYVLTDGSYAVALGSFHCEYAKDLDTINQIIEAGYLGRRLLLT